MNNDALDERLRDRINAHLCWDDCVGTEGIDVSVDNGRVTLKGKVSSIRERSRAEEDARAVHGVREVDNQLVVAPAMRPQDGEITQAIKSMLEWSGDIDASRIAVSSDGGIVTLEGSVDAYWKKPRVEEIASDAGGVRGVTNNLTVIPRRRAEDPNIESEIRAAFERTYAIDNSGITVGARGGHVTLAGTVPTWDMYIEAEEIARHTGGVTGVTNKLSVE